MRGYEVGDLVFSRSEIHNDGGIPDVGDDALLAAPGTRGVVVRTGSVQSRPETRLYLVRFEGVDKVLGPPVGCFEEELTQDESAFQGSTASAAGP